MYYIFIRHQRYAAIVLLANLLLANLLRQGYQQAKLSIIDEYVNTIKRPAKQTTPTRP